MPPTKNEKNSALALCTRVQFRLQIARRKSVTFPCAGMQRESRLGAGYLKGRYAFTVEFSCLWKTLWLKVTDLNPFRRICALSTTQLLIKACNSHRGVELITRFAALLEIQQLILHERICLASRTLFSYAFFKFIVREFVCIVKGQEVRIQRDIPTLRDNVVPTISLNLPKYISRSLPKKRKRRTALWADCVPAKKCRKSPHWSTLEDGQSDSMTTNKTDLETIYRQHPCQTFYL